ncbi:MAG: DJ-1/PfpI family protein [Bacteroidales bacterium]|nr:DJ-1/PfpI family protein [Bacteroidales bacterium]MDY6002458.1 DJ-1 family glyoxalase III [Candidatus Cryptobacteroides sp.]
MKGIHIFLADGFEDTEAIATLDVLRRAGIEVKTVSMNEDRLVTSSRGVPICADVIFKDINSEANGACPADVMVFPGGMPGTKHLAANSKLIELMKQHYADGGIVAAICAAPGLVASQLPDLRGKKFTCFDGFEDALIAKGAEYVKAPSVVDGNLITGRGAGCAIDFGCAIVRKLKGADAVSKVRHGMMLD